MKSVREAGVAFEITFHERTDPQLEGLVSDSIFKQDFLGHESEVSE